MHFNSSQAGGSSALPGLRPGVTLIHQGEEAELRDNSLGQVVKLGEAAALIVSLLDGTRDAAAVLLEAGKQLGSPLDPMGLVDLLQALDQRALLDTPRARAVVSQGLIRADVAALRRLSQRARPLMKLAANPSTSPEKVRMAAGSRFSCNSCTRCCTDKHLLGPVSADEVQKILAGFKATGLASEARASDFIPLGNDGQPPEAFLLRTENGRCSFLQESGLCGIHERLGEELKPAACRLFPFQPVRTLSGWDVGLSLSCPTVASGGGDDANSEALKTVSSLATTSSLLQVLTDTVQLDSFCKVPYELYGSWEEKSVARLLDGSEEPARAWVSVVEDFEALLQKQTGYQADSWLELSYDDTSTVEMSNVSESEPVISERGQGELNLDVGRAADILLRDLGVWLELLVGLEAADPGALRRVRRGLVRLRSALDVSPRSAPVLAERARISQLAHDAADTLGDNFKSEDSAQLTATRPAIRPVHTNKVKAEVLEQRFLVQALVGKSLFRYSTVRHGLLAITIHLALMRLEDIESDPYCPKIEDISYLFQHPQFLDVIDSRAIVRHHAGDGSIHRSILGVGYQI